LLQPPKLTGLKKRIEELDSKAREAVGDFLALVAQADDRVTPEEIRQLQKIFRLLGLEPDSVFSKVHAAATEPVSVSSRSTIAWDAVENETSGFAIPGPPDGATSARQKKGSQARGAGGNPGLGERAATAPTATKESRALTLDAGKVAALQRDSERVAAILAAVFDAPPDSMADVVPNKAPDAAEDHDTQQDLATETLIGLDAVHSALLETLLTRTHWARSELEELAEDRELMLDGALERLNEACFDRFDMALFEGVDPLEVNAEVVREVRGVEHQES
jgi:hypothetical protein